MTLLIRLSLLLLQDTPGVCLLAPAQRLYFSHGMYCTVSLETIVQGKKRGAIYDPNSSVMCLPLESSTDCCCWDFKWKVVSWSLFQCLHFLARCVGQHHLPSPWCYQHFLPALLWRFHKQNLHKTLQTLARCHSHPGLWLSQRRYPLVKGCLEEGGITWRKAI